MPRNRLTGMPPCPYEDLTRERCTCENRAGWACDSYYCLCGDRNTNPKQKTEREDYRWENLANGLMGGIKP